MSGVQLTFDDSRENSFAADGDFTDPEQWCFETKTPETLNHAGCARCGKKPASLNPLPAGWAWDTMEPTNPWLWCPHWHLDNGCESIDATTNKGNNDGISQ